MLNYIQEHIAEHYPQHAAAVTGSSIFLFIEGLSYKSIVQSVIAGAAIYLLTTLFKRIGIK